MTIRIKQVGANFVYEVGPLAGTPVATGGPVGAVQFNDGDVFGGDSNFTFDKTTDTLTVSNLSGSLTRLPSGESYLVAGSNVTIATASNGQITISSMGSGTPAGSNRQIQFNDNGSFGADDSFIYDVSSETLFLSGALLIGTGSQSQNEIFVANKKITDAASLTKQTAAGSIYAIVTGSTSLTQTVYGEYNRTENYVGGPTTGFISAWGSRTLHASTSSLVNMWVLDPRGVVGLPRDGNTAGNVTRLIGASVSCGFENNTNLTGSITDLIGLRYNRFNINADRTVTNHYGLQLLNLGATAGVTNAIGIDISEINTATGIKLGIRTQDPIVVGTTNVDGSEKLRISGTSKFDGNVSVTGSLGATLGLSGSLTKLTDGTSYLIAGTGISVSSASNGPITLSTTGAATVAGLNKQVQFNDNGVFGGDGGFIYDKSLDSLIVSGSVLIGTPSVTYEELLSIDQTLSANSTLARVGSYIKSTIVGPSLSETIQYGLVVEATNKAESAPGYGVTSFQSFGYHQSTSSIDGVWGYIGGGSVKKPEDGNTAGNVSSMVGLYASIGYVAEENFTGSITNAYGIRYSNAGINASRTITNSYGIKLNNVGSTGVTNAYGIDIASITASGMKLGIRVQDPVVVGSSGVSSTEKLRVVGDTRLEGTTTSVGNIIPGSDSTYTLGTANNRWAHVYTGDLHLRNERGDWTIVEEKDYLCVVNNKTGKKHKMMLQPLDDED